MFKTFALLIALSAFTPSLFATEQGRCGNESNGPILPQAQVQAQLAQYPHAVWQVKYLKHLFTENRSRLTNEDLNFLLASLEALSLPEQYRQVASDFQRLEIELESSRFELRAEISGLPNYLGQALPELETFKAAKSIIEGKNESTSALARLADYVEHREFKKGEAAWILSKALNLHSPGRFWPGAEAFSKTLTANNYDRIRDRLIRYF